MKKQYQLYSDAELSVGAKHWRLTIDQERERLRILQAPEREWPKDLVRFVSRAVSDSNDGLPIYGIDLVHSSVVRWLRLQPTTQPQEQAQALLAA